ncbi:bactofilin family protein [Paenibacillus brevis]|uniref:Polymer-forming cytoskeletal protein n=1 Tax=Paenibacillus brevis TaxID=2841508 RepID=A0ABS6FM03_9BACL|nr:polymer-forming cytoskeletal protein [Paenibacillus brevis]MBU5671245.1 polymer-forming cytoskeletal protein [Paenibacillus brevis]
MRRKNKLPAGTRYTLIGLGSFAQGKLECEANLRIEGHFQGEIDCAGQVVIGETGEAKSSIHGAEIIVAGRVIGDIVSEGRLTITGSGQVDGNVHVTKLIIVEGGLLNGSSHMEREAAVQAYSKDKEKEKSPDKQADKSTVKKQAPRPEAG